MGKYDVKFYVAKDSFNVNTVNSTVGSVQKGSIWSALNTDSSCITYMTDTTRNLTYGVSDSWIKEHFVELPNYAETFNKHFIYLLKEKGLNAGSRFKVVSDRGFEEVLVVCYKGRTLEVVIEGDREPLLHSGYLCSLFTACDFTLEKCEYKKDFNAREVDAVAKVVSAKIGMEVARHVDNEGDVDFYVNVGEEVVNVSVFPNTAKLTSGEEMAERVIKLFKGEYLK